MGTWNYNIDDTCLRTDTSARTVAAALEIMRVGGSLRVPRRFDSAVYILNRVRVASTTLGLRALSVTHFVRARVGARRLGVWDTS